jgi:hypothetical protein
LEGAVAMQTLSTLRNRRDPEAVAGLWGWQREI